MVSVTRRFYDSGPVQISAGINMPDNLNEFNRLTDEGVPKEEAAVMTWSGQKAKAGGFSKIEFKVLEGSPGQYTEVLVHFKKKP